jgi:GNAT superfamily N-acetyltransferase
VIVRPLVSADRAQWQPLWEGYLEFYRASVAPEVHDVTFARLTGGCEPMGGLMAIDGGEAVGIVHWITHRSCWTIGDYCYLQDLFVAPGRRGSGIGRKLIEARRERLPVRGCTG